ncbi:hypothetical protein SKAU_G00107860 [Synaphobranchus kaupii]|uniref:peptidylprolyl isomerase n=1 Tax=Synaphobranchus kaupii TaxID=118154 RepID=A0A9Q1J842_SYNKA|nr:hypothetical protein SKAU_G00107860 [Synaphobranchus kaupii]
MGVEIETITRAMEGLFPKKDRRAWCIISAPLQMAASLILRETETSPFKFKIGKQEVIRGWEEGVVQMSVGQRAKLTCTPDFAYGNKGHPGIIPPNATLIFDVELLSLE